MIYVSEQALREIALEAAVEVTTEIGRLHKQDFHAAICERLSRQNDPHLLAAAIDKAAQAMTRDFGERHNPRRHRRSGGLFHPRSMCKLGGGIWVWMEYATPTDLTEWGRVSSRNTVRTISAEAEKQQYILDRTDAFRAHPYIEQLGPLERAVFRFTQDAFDDVDSEVA